MTAPRTPPADRTLDRLIERLAAGESSPRPAPREDLPAPVRRALGLDMPERLRPAAVLVPLIDRPEGATVLFTLRADHLRAHAGQISFPGGRSEDDDRSVEDTALREAWEEVGLSRDRVSVIGRLDSYPTGTGFLVTPVVGIVDPDMNLTLDPNEVAETFEVPLAFLRDEERYQSGHLRRNGVDIPYYTIDYRGWRIWGATAGMLRHLIDRLR